MGLFATCSVSGKCSVFSRSTADYSQLCVFLRLNGFDPAADSDDWERLVLDVVSGKIDREQTTRWLRKLARKMA